MALLTAKGISSVAIELLVRRLALPRTVTLVPGEEFSGSNGDTLTLRVPQPQASRTQASRGAALTADDITEVGVDVAMSHLYHLKNLSDQELEFDVKDFARQITLPQVEAIALGVEDLLVTEINGITADTTTKFALTATEANTIATVLAMRKALSTNSVPPEGRFLAVSNDIAVRLLTVSQFVKANESGSADALRNAVIGRIYGFDVVEVNGLTAGTAVAYHRSAFGLAVRAPARPRGASESASASAQGISMRQVFQYDPNTAQDQSLVSTFAGAKKVTESGGTLKRAFKVRTNTT